MGDSPPRWCRVAWYAFTIFAGFLFPAAGYRLDLVSFHAPLVYESNAVMFNDTLLILPMVQATLEQGTHWINPRMGFPGVQHMHDFPVIDHLHFALIWLIGLVTGSTILTFNIYYLLGYPLAAVSMLAVLRHLNLSFPAAVTCGILFTALPYHQLRGQNHYFLSAYYMVPVTSLMMLWVCAGRLPFYPEKTRFRVTDRDTVFAVIVMLLTGCAGAYYAFFACGLLLMAGVYGWLVGHTWRAVASSWLIIGLVVACGAANHLPTFLYHVQQGKYTAPVDRPPEDAESYGLKITQLVLPVDDHKLQSLAEFKSIYNSYTRPAQVPTERYSLGAVLALAFLGLMAGLLLPVRGREPFGALIALTGFAVVIGVVGGFGAIFNQTITPAVRCYNRIAIYIAFFCLVAIAFAGDTTLAWMNRRRSMWPSRAITFVVWAGLLWVALWDMTPNDWGTEKRAHDIIANQQDWFADAEFFGRIEEAMNPNGDRPGPAIFQLPYVGWPESPPVHQLGSYDHARGYLHTKTLRWSFGCMKGRETDEWARSVSVLAPNAVAPMLDRLARAGFEGILLDARGYTPAHARLLEQQLMKTIAGANPIRHPDGKQVFFDLRRHRDDIRQGRDWDAEQYRETHRLCILWLEGFVTHTEPGYEWRKRWCGPHGVALFVNPTDETRRVTCTFRIYTDFKEPSTLTIAGGDIWSETLTIDRSSASITRTFTIPPGRHRIQFDCVPPATHIPNEHRRLTFLISGLRFE